MNLDCLEFEKPIYEIEKDITLLLHLKKEDRPKNFDTQLAKLQKKSKETTTKIFQKLNSWQITQLARHHNRPHMLDYVKRMFTEFDELCGDRNFGDDKAIIGGIARFEGRSIMVIGHQKGRDINEKIIHNFGMPKPEGYRKALRLMKLAERFNMPIITFIDTSGAYPGVGAEERGQAHAIAINLQEMANISVPIICNVIGEGGSGGALAIGVGDRINMLEYAIYSVISPEGCASILYKDSQKAELAAQTMAITSTCLQELNLIDTIVKEPLGGAHRNYDEVASTLKEQLKLDLEELNKLSIKKLKEQRLNKILHYSYFKKRLL